MGQWSNTVQICVTSFINDPLDSETLDMGGRRRRFLFLTNKKRDNVGEGAKYCTKLCDVIYGQFLRKRNTCYREECSVCVHFCLFNENIDSQTRAFRKQNKFAIVFFACAFHQNIHLQFPKQMKKVLTSFLFRLKKIYIHSFLEGINLHKGDSSDADKSITKLQLLQI